VGKSTWKELSYSLCNKTCPNAKVQGDQKVSVHLMITVAPDDYSTIIRYTQTFDHSVLGN